MFNIDNLKNIDIKNLNPQSLAFVGDAVFSLYIRHKIVLADNDKPTEQHKHTTIFVKAKGQSDIIKNIEPMLTSEELQIYKRARNYKTNNIAKNSSVIDYKRATGFEALLGYHYLTNNTNRLNEILEMSYKSILDENLE